LHLQVEIKYAPGPQQDEGALVVPPAFVILTYKSEYNLYDAITGAPVLLTTNDDPCEGNAGAW